MELDVMIDLLALFFTFTMAVLSLLWWVASLHSVYRVAVWLREQTDDAFEVMVASTRVWAWVGAVVVATTPIWAIAHFANEAVSR